MEDLEEYRYHRCGCWNAEGQCVVPWMIGTLIEVPCAAISANQIATETEFFPFRTHDVSPMGCGSSCDNAGRF